MKAKNTATLFAVLAASFYAVNIPLSKLMLGNVGTTMMAAFLYLGAGTGMLIYGMAVRTAGYGKSKDPLTKAELPYTAAMVVLDIAAPIFLMMGISSTNSANVSLLNNFEIVATSLIAWILFREVVSAKLWVAIILVTVASIILSFKGEGAFVINKGSLFVIAACICWGFENNCTRKISNKSSEEIVVIKGIFSGTGSFAVALLIGEDIPEFKWMAAVMALGFVSYGLSIDLYIRAQKELGAAKTSAYYSIAPFLGVAFSMVLLKEDLHIRFYIALIIMIAATLLMVRDSIALQHTHSHGHLHTHQHTHGDIVHTHSHIHEHSHIHIHRESCEDEHTHDPEELDDHDHLHMNAEPAEEDKDS